MNKTIKYVNQYHYYITGNRTLHIIKDTTELDDKTPYLSSQVIITVGKTSACGQHIPFLHLTTCITFNP